MHYFGVDIGNSGCRVSRLDVSQGQLAETHRVRWRFGTQRGADAETAPLLPSDSAWLAAFADPMATTPATWLISSVRRDATRVLLPELLRRGHFIRELVWSDLPLSVALPKPAGVGIDRLLAALAAERLAKSEPSEPSLAGCERVIVIQAGSAVTVDLLQVAHPPDDRPSFRGGAILPGIPMMLRLLGQAADLLPVLDADDLTDLPALPGQNTEQAMLCGAASALVGGVVHLIQRYRQVWGQDLPVILSGGDGTRLAPHIAPPVFVQADLVQHGLLTVAQDLHSST